MGGHGVHTTPNENNFKETDEEMLGKIQNIETIKYNPTMFHLNPLSPTAAYQIVGGAPACGCSLGGALLSYGYYAAQKRTYNIH